MVKDNVDYIENLVNELGYRLISPETRTTFSVRGHIVPKARPRMGAHSVYTPKATADCERSIRSVASKHFSRPYFTPVRVELLITEVVPTSGTKAEKLLRSIQLVPPRKGDLDNKVKTITDALNGVAYVDDSQICAISACREYGNEAITTVTVIQAGFSDGELDAIKKKLTHGYSGKSSAGVG